MVKVMEVTRSRTKVKYMSGMVRCLLPSCTDQHVRLNPGYTDHNTNITVITIGLLGKEWLNIYL